MPFRNKPLTATVACIACVALFAVAALATADDPAAVFKQLGVTRAEAESMVQDNLRDLPYRYPAACKQIPPAQRGAVVRTVGKFATAFVQSAAFATWYASYRDEQKPEKPEEAMTVAELRARQVAELKKAIAQGDKDCAAAKAELRAHCEPALTAMRKSLAVLQNADTSRDAELDAAAAAEHAEVRREYATKVAEWEKTLPAGNPKPLVERRIRAFLAATQTVDYAAALVKVDGRMQFKRADYETKPPQWKMAFRAGKEATESARAIAESWLKEAAKSAKPAPEPAKP